MINKYQGCLLGLAIGDALGAPVEFLTLQETPALRDVASFGRNVVYAGTVKQNSCRIKNREVGS